MDDEGLPRFAGVVYDQEEGIDALVGDFVEGLLARKLRVGGLLQGREPDAEGVTRTVVRVIGKARRIVISQNLGRHSTACSIDSAAIAEAAVALRQALEERPALIVGNRFGHLELEGAGMSEEMLDILASGTPFLIPVARRFEEGWRRFTGDMGDLLDPRPAALTAWFEALAPVTA
ncbi:DUF2478 domain-containing protein [Rhodospirillum rubrum]|uniref:Molybdenum ABC transporter ATP-binding protein n=1 Tax=Rhodospirillum rubrum (strain ATCC 11170 / ATH 1.1.1 / DSM 467 / LMG 4362 / NCIMB 8255 / S1) TaxID=269796 RepID=Q2RPC9_RHORT|nr:DUF2478 domain-containing protein [Rhodospirillum rubrum]ABC24016.1 conserved hypothetical protein [Rhodospirillum rubrum ATCC 11170]AEO49761.1 hypothetical protein F11_16495 [Rhodospirillum rubrum F11]MBK5955700.1 hypothetical protein [Rhodospirillum rubrum]QXG79959.1 DUF2478 domain-containing protein [Rhodospirillum rubrum]HAP98699.1 DUF2478 domain-containing protein [Rhodospirillum rubrum]